MNRPSLYDDSADSDLWSRTAIGNERLTWKELAERNEERLRAAERIIAIISDLDRCPHGRHETDDCFSCQSEGHDRNQGNPYLKVGQRLGSNLSGKPIYWPGYPGYNDPDAWHREGT